MAKSNKLGFPHQVYEELEEQKDELFDWCKERKELLIIDAAEETEIILVELIAEFPDSIGELGTGSSYADLYVIATAEFLDWKVVTLEDFSTSPKRKKWKIPNICQHRGIDFIPPYQLVKNEGWIFEH